MLLPSRDDAIDRLTLLFRALGSGGGGGVGGLLCRECSSLQMLLDIHRSHNAY